MKKNRLFGFTLIELMIVISIIGIVSAFGLAVNFRGSQRTARDGRRKSDLEQIRSALEMYRVDQGAYPDTYPDDLIAQGYLASEIEDPQDPERQYYYFRDVANDTYALCAALERGSGGVASGCGSCGEACDYATYSPGQTAPVSTPTPAATSTPTLGPTPTPTPTIAMVDCNLDPCGTVCGASQTCLDSACSPLINYDQTDCECDGNCSAGLVCCQRVWGSDYCCNPGDSCGWTGCY